MQTSNTQANKPYQLNNYIAKDDADLNVSPEEVTDPGRQKSKAREDGTHASFEEVKTPMQPQEIVHNRVFV